MLKPIINSKNKTKIEIILSKDVIGKIKEYSIKEGKTISELIEEAIIRY